MREKFGDVPRLHYPRDRRRGEPSPRTGQRSREHVHRASTDDRSRQLARSMVARVGGVGRRGPDRSDRQMHRRPANRTSTVGAEILAILGLH